MIELQHLRKKIADGRYAEIQPNDGTRYAVAVVSELDDNGRYAIGFSVGEGFPSAVHSFLPTGYLLVSDIADYYKVSSVQSLRVLIAVIRNLLPSLDIIKSYNQTNEGKADFYKPLEESLKYYPDTEDEVKRQIEYLLSNADL